MKAQVTDEGEFTTAELMTVQIAQLISLKLLRLTLTEDIQIGTADIWHKYEFLQQNLKERYKTVPFTGRFVSSKNHCLSHFFRIYDFYAGPELRNNLWNCILSHNASFIQVSLSFELGCTETGPE